MSNNCLLILQIIVRTFFHYLNQDNNETNDLHCRKLYDGAKWNDAISLWETVLPKIVKFNCKHDCIYYYWVRYNPSWHLINMLSNLLTNYPTWAGVILMTKLSWLFNAQNWTGKCISIIQFRKFSSALNIRYLIHYIHVEIEDKSESFTF